MTSTGGISAASLRVAVVSRVAVSLVEAGSFLVIAVVSFMVVPPGSLDGDAAGLRRFAALDADVEHAVTVIGGHAVGIDVVRQTDHPPEPAAESLVDMNGGFFVIIGG
jgi:hypothetical protein